MSEKSKIIMVNGPVVKADKMTYFKMNEMVMVGDKKLIGEVISIEGENGTIQVYEETEGTKIGEAITGTGKPLSVTLGPGLIGNIFDGIQRPLNKINEINEDFISEGIGLISIDKEKIWEFEPTVKIGDEITEGDIFGTVKESIMIQHRLLVPNGINGEVISILEEGEHNIETVVLKLKDDKDEVHELKMYQEWPVRISRPIDKRLMLSKPLITGQRVLDIFFPIAKGGTAAIPGGFGTGKTMTQHQLAKWSDADVIVYIGCGERGNEMTDVLEEFPKLIDPRSGKAIMERTILIANTSNMPVAAREASVYTGITIAEYYRDMGYHVSIMADSTSRWAEALREISGRLEEMPAEEGYPAYLPSRLAEFYERAGYVQSLCKKEGSITIIGAVSPAGGDFSEPVTENTKRFVNTFLALDKKLAYARHYPSVNWLSSYSGYLKILEDWYLKNAGHESINLRSKMLKLLFEENKLSDIVALVGEDVLPDDQRLIIEISKIIKIGFLQQNAFHKEDTYVPLKKQIMMLETIEYLYDKAAKAISYGTPITKAKNDKLFSKVMKMKYSIPNDDLSGIEDLKLEIKTYYNDLIKLYKKKKITQKE